MNEKLNDILIKYKLNEIDKNTLINEVLDSLSMIRLILELEDKLKIKLNLNVNLKIKDIDDKII
jgi:acyl carrier protein